MSKSKERRAKEQERRIALYGYVDTRFKLEDIYPFQLWLQGAYGWRLFVTEGPELARMYLAGRYIIIWYDGLRICANRQGRVMVISYLFHQKGIVG